MASNSEPLQNASPSDLQPRRAYKPARSRKAPSVKAAVISARVQGISKLQIARDLGMSKNTVNTIIEEANLDQIMEDGRLQTFTRLPAALKTLDARLEKNSENAALWLLDKCFDSSNKGARPHDTGLTLAIQNLMGNVQVNQVQSKDNTQVSGPKPEPAEPQQDTLDCSTESPSSSTPQCNNSTENQ